ncbi:MAG: RidA family protein [Alphaproteobacteria bacterium]
MPHATLLPDGWPRPKGYANGVAARGTLVFVAGQIGWTSAERFEADDLPGQVEQALRNVVAVLAAGGARPEHLVRMTWYVVDKADYARRTAEIGAAYRRVVGAVYPAMTLVEVKSLLETRALVEIECTAVIPD